ncbi:hypothetical protein [Alteromonas facilis]|uniref:hypothetical protein n=1 Tax=Alteromonas facilis TaxID=2048004 RepID=UPI000C28E21B|nr:hypothetical protein [Alteromonas facilis]
MVRLLGGLLLFVVVSAFAEEEPAPPPPLDPKYMGEHHFVLMSSESDLYAAYLPRYSSPSDLQLVYLVDAKGPNLFYLVRDADLVTVKTSEFNLERLIRGESVALTLDAYLGDFRLGASQVYDDVAVNFSRSLYYRSLESPEPSGLRQTYDIVELGGDERLMVHKIKRPPSFQHIVLVEEARNCVNQFFMDELVPSENSLLMKLLFCGSLKPLYYNASDFQ